jgi:hypothetical protein
MACKHSDFVDGSRWKVTQAGARLFGWKPIPGGHEGWVLTLEPGMILTCAGSSMTMGDGVPAIKWRGENGEFLASDCTFSPVKGGMWGGQIPEDGFLERLEGDSAVVPVPVV